ncbi:MAG: DNA polymerase III subunit gamma/tau, partial [Primorskyibacter sp.]
LALITRSAEGSARDAQSLLDQAISHGAGETSAEQVRAMLGLADRGRVLDLFDMIMGGDAGGALTELGAQYADGADPMAVLRDLAEITHWISLVKITPASAEDPTISPDERSRGLDMAGRLPMRGLTRMWQMLLKALDEVSSAPNAMMAAEMAVIRLTHVAELPSPDELIRKLQDTPPPTSGGYDGGGHMGGPAPQGQTHGHMPNHMPGHMQGGGGHPAHSGGPSGPVAQIAVAGAVDQALARFPTFEHVLDLIRANRDKVLQIDVERALRLASYAPGRIEFTPTPDAPKDLAQRLGSALQRWTGNRWGVSIVNGCDTPTLYEVEHATDLALRAEAESHDLVQAALAAFPGAKIAAVRTPEDIAAEAEAEALPEVDDEWDPFEEDGYVPVPNWE